METNDGNGGIRWIVSRGRPVTDANGRVARYIGIAVDITERKRSEQMIRESEKNHRLLIANLHAGVIVHAPDMEIRLCNQVAAEIIGLDSDEIIGKPP